MPGVSAHLIFDILAYSGGSALYWHFKKRDSSSSSTSLDQTITLTIALLFGAAIGAKCLAWLEHPHLYFPALLGSGVEASSHSYLPSSQSLQAWLGGKTLVGGLLGAWFGVEIAKHRLKITESTGDAFVLPLIWGIGIGRWGCFLSGLADHTHGLPSHTPFAYDFGDGIPRHPTQLYESCFVFMFGALLIFSKPIWSRYFPTKGSTFRLFLSGYLLWRFFIEFLKPSPKFYAGLSAIQWASVIGASIAIASLRRLNSPLNLSLTTGDL